jgi:hypothetical protein
MFFARQTTSKLTYVRLILILLCIASGINFIYRAYSYFSQRQTIIDTQKAQIITDSRQAAATINTLLLELKKTADALANELSNKNFTKETLIAKLYAKPNNISGLGVALAPHAFDKQEKLYAPYVAMFEGKNKLTNLGNLYDYTLHERYLQPQSQNKGVFLDTTLDSATDALVMEYSTPIIDAQGNFKGVVFANYRMSYINEVLRSLEIARKGYPAIISQTGSYLFYPHRAFMLEHTKIFDVSPEYAQMGQKAIKGEEGIAQYTSTITGEDSWVVYCPIASAHWSLIGTFGLDDLDLTPENWHQDLINAALSLLLFCIFLVCILVRVSAGSLKAYWIVSSTIALACALGIAIIWLLTPYRSLTTTQQKTTIIDSEPSLQDFLATVQTNFKKSNMPLPYLPSLPITTITEDTKAAATLSKERTLLEIPTGIYISELEFNTFLGVNKVEIVGTIWQRYTKGIHDDVKRGVQLPQATEVKLEEIYHHKRDNFEVIGWHLHAVLMQDFDYHDYPFDVKKVAIKIWPIDIFKPVILVPDLLAYKVLAIGAASQIGPDVRKGLLEWYVDKSYFNYQSFIYLTNFGFYRGETIEGTPKSEIPDLLFSIVLKRYIISSLILNLAPILIILMLLFLVLVLAGRTMMRIEHVIGSIASLFFTALIAYNRFEDALPVQYIVFLENFYQMLHVTIFIVALLSFLYLLKANLRLLGANGMLIPQLLFWPLVAGYGLLISMLYFY